MTIASLCSTSEPDADLATRFAHEAKPFFDVLSRGARRLTRSNADAEDLVQETLLHAYKGFHTFKGGTNLQAWLFRILYNRWISTYRCKQRRPLELLTDDITERDVADSAETEVLDALPDNEIKAAMNAMPESFRTVVYYADIQGYTYAETAAILNIPHGTRMSRASRSRQRDANRAGPRRLNLKTQRRRNDRCRNSMSPAGRRR
jgi:RNA polymerase sigma factor (sigma-70 family)